jgi:predicted P-loop ATPase/GTPase
VESYADIARPLSGFEPDAVAVVEPGRARFYDGRRYAKACQIATGSAGEGQLEERVGNVVDLIERTGAVRLPALDSATQSDPDAVAEAYSHAYDALLATAFD